MTRYPAVLVVIFICSLSEAAWAWSDAGHKISASIAFRKLDDAQRKKVIELLRKHPRFQEDFADKMPDDLSETSQQEWLFQQAAVWPDLVRSPSHPGHHHHRPAWHFVNFPVFIDASHRALVTVTANISVTPPSIADDKMNLIQTIEFAKKTLKDSSAADVDKAVMLAWLFHTVSDAHQPLHASAVFTPRRYPTGNKGGNAVRTTQRQNLHSLWDRFPGAGISLRQGQNESFGLLRDPALNVLGESAKSNLNAEDWIKESLKISEELAYAGEVLNYLKSIESSTADDEDLPRLNLSEAYLKAGGAKCKERLVEGGYRLAEILKGL